MKKAICILLGLMFVLSACGQNSLPTADAGASWQEQYDLGVRYLSDGNYEEAIIAFSAAIEIDPKRAPAYVGRGDAHSGVALLVAGGFEELPAEAVTSYQSAAEDYLAAIELDETVAEVYRKAAEVYIELGDTESAIAMLTRGYEATGDESLLERREALEQADHPEEDTVKVNGQIIYNPDIYSEAWYPYIDMYQTSDDSVRCSIDGFGVRFATPIEATVDGEVVSIQEATFNYPEELIDSQSMLHNDASETNGPLIGPTLEMVGTFSRNEQTEELEGPVEEPDGIYYNYRPNGDYVFHMESYEILE